MLFRFNYTIFMCAFLTLIYAGKTKAQTVNDTFLIEAEDFQFPGKWLIADDAEFPGTRILRVGETTTPDANGYTAIDVKTAGTYYVWTRSRDYPTNKPGTRLYQIYVNEIASGQKSGKHGQPGYYWENVATVTLNAGDALLQIKDSDGYYGRCDAVLLSKSNFNPNASDLNALKTSYKINPKMLVSVPASSQAAEPYRSVANVNQTNVELSNSKLKLSFVTITDQDNAQRIVATVKSFKEGQWVAINGDVEANRIFLLKSTDPGVDFMGINPIWEKGSSQSIFQCLGKSFSVFDPAQAKNPFGAGQLLLCKATAVQQISAQEIRVTYAIDGGQTLTGTWKLATDASHFSVALNFTAQQQGYYGFVVTGIQPVEPSAVKNVQLPPMYQYQRLPDQPLLVPTASTPQPISIVETTINNQPFSFFVSGALSNFPLEWGTGETSPFGFSLKNESNKVQPVGFGPVLGFSNSKLNAGQSINREFIIGAVWSSWDGALEHFSNQIYQVKDYRKQTLASLTNTALNIVDLINHDTASGWDSNMKGFYDIEQDPVIAPVVANMAPLTLLSAAVLGKDEEMYLKRALPSIEYSLSRRGYRWSTKQGTLYTPTAASLQLNPNSKEFNIAYFEGLDKLLGSANPWIKDLALPNGALRTSGSWTEQLAAYRLTKEGKWLNGAISNANTFLSNDVYGAKTDVLSQTDFYNAKMYPVWWNLMDLYEITKNNDYLAAAERSAFHTIAGLRSFPQVGNGLQTIHPGNKYDGTTKVWWRGTEQYRLGFPRQAGDVQQKTVSQDLVSPVGLGIEQPSTLFYPKDQSAYVYMSNWSPNLLRLYQYSSREIFQTYARNSIIGRFSNHPGYYARGFTDVPMQPNFPYVGPDVSAIYYHHIPAQLAFTYDFLITEAMQRSQGNINFPYSKQEGFVWFNNRIFGGGKGKIYDDPRVSLYLKKDIVQLDNVEVNYITAVSENKFWVILMNEASEPSSVQLTLSNNIDVISNSEAQAFSNDDCNATPITMNGRTVQTTLSPKNVTAISFPLTDSQVEVKVPKIANGMQTISVDNNWGKLYVFRIRSPFGWDSIYAYMEASPLNNSKASLQTNLNGQKIERIAYPYEWSLTRIPYDKEVTLSLDLTLNGSSKNILVTVEGTNDL